MLYGLLVSLEANPILVFLTVTAFRLMTGTVARLRIRSLGMHASVHTNELEQNIH